MINFNCFTASTLLNPEDSCRIEHDDCKLRCNDTQSFIFWYFYLKYVIWLEIVSNVSFYFIKARSEPLQTQATDGNRSLLLEGRLFLYIRNMHYQNESERLYRICKYPEY